MSLETEKDLKGRVVLVTGANGGLGLGVCERLVDEWDDTLENLTIIITTRSMIKAINTVDIIMKHYYKKKRRQFKLEIKSENIKSNTIKHVLTVDYVLIDFADMKSIAIAAKTVSDLYAHINSIICNAGTGDFIGVDWKILIKEFLFNPIKAVTFPGSKIQGIGRKSTDGLGYVFQTNFFGHWFLVNELIPNLQKSNHLSLKSNTNLKSNTSGGKIIWVSSLESYPSAFNLEDYQALQSEVSYESSKRLTDLICYACSDMFYEKYGITNILVHPGIIATSIFANHLSYVMILLMNLTFYIVRLIGSPWHCVKSYKGAVAVVWAILFASSLDRDNNKKKYGSAITRLGKEYVLPTDYEVDKEEAFKALEKVEELRREWKTRV